MKSFLVLLACAPLGFGQSTGVATPWDVRKMLDAMETHVKRLLPLLDEMKPEDWVQRGAPYTYVQQWKTAKDEAAYFETSAEALSRQPEKMSQALDTFFRLESLQIELGSLVDGVRKYHNPPAADVLQAVMNEGSRNHDQFRQYLTDLAADKEHEFQVMDREAQRCRGTLSRQPVPRTK